MTQVWRSRQTSRIAPFALLAQVRLSMYRAAPSAARTISGR